MSIYITWIDITDIRHLNNISIPLKEKEGKGRNLIITGKNGSGKTSVLEAMSIYLDSVSTTNNSVPDGIGLMFNIPAVSVRHEYEDRKFILDYFDARHRFVADEAYVAEKAQFKNHYSMMEKPRNVFLQHMVDLKLTQGLALLKKNLRKEREIGRWFDTITEILRDIYEERELDLQFDEKNYNFLISIPNRKPFDFNTASDGFSAIMDIVVDIILKMTVNNNMVFSANVPGIVLIDEIETHLHLSLQKKIFKYLTKLFPKIQFIVSTHSPFILVNAYDAVIYDLEKRIYIEDGLSDVSYSSVVDGYFEVDEFSDSLRNDFRKYKELVSKDSLSNVELVEIARLENRLDNLPAYLSLNISTEYKRLKLEKNRKRQNV